MRFLILSDIHGNWEALEAVLECAEGSYDRVVCCGDLVGYGADPDRVTEWVREHIAGIVRGNHDKACAGIDDLEWFNPVARVSAVWTMTTIRSENLEYLRGLQRGPLPIDGFELVHGSPLDEDEYVLSEEDVAQLAPYLEADLFFFGHTHVQGGFLCHRNGILRVSGPVQSQVEIALERDQRYLFNPGSVGQPRDGDPRAAFATYDGDERLVTLGRVSYDVSGAQKKILSAGLPDILALRLQTGS